MKIHSLWIQKADSSLAYYDDMQALISCIQNFDWLSERKAHLKKLLQLSVLELELIVLMMMLRCTFLIPKPIYGLCILPTKRTKNYSKSTWTA